MTPRLVIFDVDGTLLDSQDVIVTAMEVAFAAVDLAPPARGRILDIVGLSLPEAMAVLAPAHPDRGAALVAAYKSHVVTHLSSPEAEAAVPMYPGARAAIEDLAARPDRILGVATGKARAGLDRFFRVHGLGGHFTTLQTADLHPSKPHPGMLEAALAETGIAAGDAVMVGDTAFDMDMARSAGVLPIGVAWGYHPQARLREAGAAHVLEDFGALVPLLDRIWGEVS